MFHLSQNFKLPLHREVVLEKLGDHLKRFLKGKQKNTTPTKSGEKMVQDPPQREFLCKTVSPCHLFGVDLFSLRYKKHVFTH